MNFIPDRLIDYSPDKSYGTYKFKPDGSVVLIASIHPNLVKQFVEDMPQIYKFRNTFNRLAQVEINLKEFRKVEQQGFSKTTDAFSDLILLDESDKELVEANRLCGNFCYSWFNIIELMEKHNKNVYGEDSEIYKEWKALDNGYYEKFFEYRFVKQLRNFSHIDDPIAGVWDENGVKSALLQKYRLLQFNKFRKLHFDQDWGKLDASFPAFPIMLQSVVYLKQLIDHHLLLNKDLFASSAISMLRNFGELNKRELSIGERKKVGINSFQVIPQRLSRQIIDYFKSLEKLI